MRKIVLSLVIAGLLAPAALAATTGVKVKDNFFKPERVKIDKGDKVRWRWRASNVHNVAIKKPGSRRVVRRSALKRDGKFVHRFRKVGKWRILCEVHPRSMRMRVIVRAP